jgi:hypothetical protein
MSKEDTGSNPAERDASRRSFLARSAKKAVYMTPVIMAVGAQQAHAGVSACGTTGSPCTSNADCCGGFSCLDGMGEMVMMGGTGTCQ